MSSDVRDFIHDWISENIHFNGYPSEDGVDPEAIRLSEQLISDAEQRGFSREQLEEEHGDLAQFLHRQMERIADAEVRRQAGKDD
ncbi:hypothetical protein [Microvirga sp. TS319]|uniref:DUF768 domain-containing protein n=1 Tax=Microvirga sp. TS319 TaxID=3241165 RepID=UPI00351A2017